eukprot:668158-Rhodomonas_salina.1
MSGTEIGYAATSCSANEAAPYALAPRYELCYLLRDARWKSGPYRRRAAASTTRPYQAPCAPYASTRSM